MKTISLFKKIVLLVTCIFINILSGTRDFEISDKASPNVYWNFELYNKSGQNIVFSVDAKYWYTRYNVYLPPIELRKGTKDPLKGEKLRIANVHPSSIKIKIWLEDLPKNKPIFDKARKASEVPKTYAERLQRYAQQTQNYLTNLWNRKMPSAIEIQNYLTNLWNGTIPSDIDYEIKLKPLGKSNILAKELVLGAQYHTIFLTFDQNQRLKPQTGILKGMGPAIFGLKKTDSGLDNSNNLGLNEIYGIKLGPADK